MQVKKQQLEPDMELPTGSKLGKEYIKAVYLSPCLFNFYAEYIMRNAGLDEAQAGIKIAGRNIKNLRYADDITLMAESEEELNSLLVKVKKESEKVGLKLYIWISSNEVDETGAYYTEWSKPERKTPIQYTNAYIWNLERW